MVAVALPVFWAVRLPAMQAVIPAWVTEPEYARRSPGVAEFRSTASVRLRLGLTVTPRYGAAHRQVGSRIGPSGLRQYSGE